MVHLHTEQVDVALSHRGEAAAFGSEVPPAATPVLLRPPSSARPSSAFPPPPPTHCRLLASLPSYQVAPDAAALALPHSPKMAAVVARPSACPLCLEAGGSFKNVRFWPTPGAPPGSFSRLWRCRACKGFFQCDTPPAGAAADGAAAAAAAAATPAGAPSASGRPPTAPPAGTAGLEGELEMLAWRWRQRLALEGCTTASTVDGTS